jgi:predicted O-methyltransferase YrrM
VAAKVQVDLPEYRSKAQKCHALEFIDSIESTWKGHESFAMWLVHRIQPKVTVDLGFDRGLSTIAFAYKNKGHVYGIDWFEEGLYSEKCFALDAAFSNIADAIRFNYVKNIHLIIGPFKDVSKTWNKKIDLLHIDWAHSYGALSLHYENWKKYLRENSVLLIHDVVSHPTQVGRFFNELPYPKYLFPHANGLGVVSSDEILIEEIRQLKL